MKANPCVPSPFWNCATALALLACSTCLAAETAATNVAKDRAVAAPTFPKSQFEETSSTGHDPFYPAYRPATTASQSTNVAPPAVSSFVLHGVLRSANKKLAIINGRTFEVGEDNEISTPSGKVKIHVNEILEEKVVITVGDPPQAIELLLKEKYRLR